MMTSRRQLQRAFTLVELLVAVSAGMFVILAAFLMAKGATRLFASESRIATAQLNVRNAMDRLRSDLQRASFQTTANSLADPNVCPKPNDPSLASAPWCSTCAKMQGVQHFDQGSLAGFSTAVAPTVLTTMWSDNSLAPDAISLQGNFITTDVYPTASITQTAITLSQDEPSVQRLLQSWGTETGAATNALNSVFPSTKRVLRITNEFGRSQYVLATGASVTGSAPTGTVTISLDSTFPVLTSATSNDPQCGVIGNGGRSTINPVQTYHYWVGTLSGLGTTYDWAYPTGAPGDNTKSDLLRQEVDMTTGLATGAVEIVSEYVVDLKFAYNVDPTAAPTLSGAAYVGPTSLLSYDYGDATGITYARGVTASPGTPVGPHRIRSVRVRVTGRNRELDRQDAIDDGGANLLRIGIRAVGTMKLYARTRTLQEEVFLSNQTGLSW